MNKFKVAIFLFLINIFLPNAASAYVGPGLAFGAIIVFITVILAFIATCFLNILQFCKYIFENVNKIFSKKIDFIRNRRNMRNAKRKK